MAVLENGYVDDAVAYAYARARFPNNFTSNTPDTSFRSALYTAGDIINANNEAFVGQPPSRTEDGTPTDAEDKVWPRTADAIDTLTTYPFLDGMTIPEALIRGYEWLAITVALSPEQFGTTSSSSSEVVTTGGGLSRASYDSIAVEFAQPSTDTVKRNATSITPITLQFHFQQAVIWLKPLIRAGQEFTVPGLNQQPLPVQAGQQVFAELAMFNLVRG